MMEQLATSETFNSCSLSVVHRPAVTSNNQPHKESTSRWCLHVWVCARETIPFSALKVSPCVPFFFLRISTLCCTSRMHAHCDVMSSII